jgi:hypothetical protein
MEAGMTSTQNYGEQIVDQGLVVLQGARQMALSVVETAFDAATKVLSAQRQLASQVAGELFSKNEKPAA